MTLIFLKLNIMHEGQIISHISPMIELCPLIFSQVHIAGFYYFRCSGFSSIYNWGQGRSPSNYISSLWRVWDSIFRSFVSPLLWGLENANWSWWENKSWTLLQGKLWNCGIQLVSKEHLVSLYVVSLYIFPILSFYSKDLYS